MRTYDFISCAVSYELKVVGCIAVTDYITFCPSI